MIKCLKNICKSDSFILKVLLVLDYRITHCDLSKLILSKDGRRDRVSLKKWLKWLRYFILSLNLESGSFVLDWDMVLGLYEEGLWDTGPHVHMKKVCGILGIH